MRRVILAVSGMLFTVALLIPAASMWRAAAALFTSSPWACGPLYRHHDCFAPEGFGSLAVIAIGLIVTWAGYTKGVRWTWFVMFVIVWVWAFPLFMLSFVLRWRDAALLLPMFARAMRESGVSRNFAGIFLAFVLLVLALVLPLKSFISRPAGVPGTSEHGSSGAPEKRTSPEI